MSRVFTITFPFQDRKYTAIVILKNGHQEASMQIQLPDQALHYLIPKGVLTYTEQDGLNLRIEKNKHLTYTLVNNIVQAVEQHSYFQKAVL